MQFTKLTNCVVSILPPSCFPSIDLVSVTGAWARRFLAVLRESPASGAVFHLGAQLTTVHPPGMHPSYT